MLINNLDMTDGEFHNYFYRATRMQRRLCCEKDGYPSVRPSHAGILSKRLNVSSYSGSQTIIVFPYQTGWQ